MLLTALIVLAMLGLALRDLRNGFYVLHVALVAAMSWYVGTYMYAIQPFSFYAFFFLAIFHLISVNLVMVAMYGYDKKAARDEAWRVPERMLHLFALLGATPAAFLASRLFRHKTQKRPFRQLMWVVLSLQLGLLVGLFFWAGSMGLI